ncbi:MAG: diaminopimelate decarboxylase, partial [Flavobacterium sp.]|nr:diaminopimelate decarboxylase [Flavobacterium sp.]
MNEEYLLQLAEKYDSPLYVYDTAIIASQYKRITDAFKSVHHIQLNYAVKALSNINILRYFNTLGAGLDTVSIQEVDLGIAAGVDPQKIIYTPNGVSLEEIENVAKKGVQINIDNLSILELFGQKHPEIPVCIRINPHVMAGGNSKISVGHIDSKFGISVHQVPHIKRVVKNTGMHINGIHMHTGSDILDIDTFLRATEILFDVAKQFTSINFIDFGSGFKVPYKEGD